MARPKLVADAGMDTHILFTRVGLDRLKRRISELVQENKAERNNFKARGDNLLKNVEYADKRISPGAGTAVQPGSTAFPECLDSYPL